MNEDEFEYTNYSEGNRQELEIDDLGGRFRFVNVEKLGNDVRVSISLGDDPTTVLTVPADLWLQLLRDSLAWYEGEGVASD